MSIEKIILTKSVVLALLLTRQMADALVSSNNLKLIQASFVMGGIKVLSDDKTATRSIKTDCTFIDGKGREQVAVAWVHLIRVNGKWHPTCRGNFIKINSNPPRRMEFKPDESHPVVSVHKMPNLDFDRI